MSDILALVLFAVAVLLGMQWWKLQRLLAKNAQELVVLRRNYSTIQERLTIFNTAYEQLANTIFDALIIVDNERRVIMLNQAAREIFGERASEPNQTLISLTHHHELDTLAESAYQNKQALENQFEIEERTFRARVQAIQLGDRPVLVVALQDITQLLRLTRARRDMVANFSHDLRTPISSIRLLIDTLTRNFGKNKERDLRLLGKIAGETDSLQHMTQELIDLSMIESGKAIIRMVPVRLSAVVRQALDVMETQLEQKKLTTVNEVPKSIEILADPEQTRRVIMNVLHNAVKFTPTNGEITISASTDSQFATLRITDTGPGISPQDRNRVFERFYQVDSARSGKSAGGGSGLGLSIAKHIVEAQSGKIWAEANTPNGASIVFTVPLANDAEKSSHS